MYRVVCQSCCYQWLSITAAEQLCLDIATKDGWACVEDSLGRLVFDKFYVPAK